MSTSVAETYKAVIQDVIEGVKEDFQREGVDESVLEELKKLWEIRLMESGAVPGFGMNEMYGTYDENIPKVNQTSQMYDQNIYLPTYGTENIQQYQYPQMQMQQTTTQFDPKYLGSIASITHPQEIDPNFGRPPEFMPPPNNWMNDANINLGYNTHTTLPPLTGYPPISQPGEKRTRDEEEGAESDRKRVKQENTSEIPQIDGNDDELGPEDDVSDEEEAMPQTNHVVLCQFEKVTRTKNKWKCNLKCGIMHLNGVDFLFSRGSGEFDW